MTCKTSYELHHHFPRLAEEAGFTFNNHRPRVRIDWNRIRLIDVESLAKERKFVLVEQHINDILDCVLESEFDVRILDEGVLKMFRLAQLAVEYQQFCRHYLDRSVYVLREEIAGLLKELDTAKKDLREKDEELRKSRRKSKYSFRNPLPYGNENIATMILKTLSNKGDVFPSTSNADIPQYNKCSYCDKIFLNQLYLKSHLARRHSNFMDVPQKDNEADNHNDSEMNHQIIELKTKLKEMEAFITDVQKNQIESKKESVTDSKSPTKVQTKDVEISTNNDNYILEKIEEWKKEEHEKHNKELQSLRTQIIDTINSFKEKELEKPVQPENTQIIEQLYATIKQQGEHISNLKDELLISQNKFETAEVERRKETESQMKLWEKRVDMQTKQYEALIQKLNEVASEAHESRAMAFAEKQRADHLQALIEQSQNAYTEKKRNSPEKLAPEETRSENRNVKKAKKKYRSESDSLTDHATLEKLHRKAQELLNIPSLSSSEDSSISDKNIQKHIRIKPVKTPSQNHKMDIADVPKEAKRKRSNSLKENFKGESRKVKNDEPLKLSNGIKARISKSHSNIATNLKENGLIMVPGSPKKVVRAKLTEEVNQRLATVGVDPLNIRLADDIFRKQKSQLQLLHEHKSKRNPSRDKVRHSILAYLDSTTSVNKDELRESYSPTKLAKTFSLTSMISNVKSKALSLVKSQEKGSASRAKLKGKALSSDMAKKAMSLLKTPPDSARSSPIQTRSPDKQNPQLKELAKWSFTSKNGARNTQNKFNGQSIKPKYYMKIDLSDDESSQSDHKYYNDADVKQATSIEKLVKSPAKRPASVNENYNSSTPRKYSEDKSGRKISQSALDLRENKLVSSKNNDIQIMNHNENSSDDIESLEEFPVKKASSEVDIKNIPKTKGVLKHASSTSSLNKKKVLFDMDAIQMKSLSASPSQSLTEKSDVNEKYELGIVGLDTEDWDISSIENEPLKSDTKIQVNTRISPKITVLKETIEAQLARRSETPSTAMVGAIDVLPGKHLQKAASIAGSNTSLGSSILDDSEIPVLNTKAFVKPKKMTEKDDSELDLSEFSLEGITNKRAQESF